MQPRKTDHLSKWLKWFALICIIAASVIVIVGAVNLSPSSAQAGQIESEVLAKQLEFILKMNSAFLGFLGIIGALLTWFFKNNLEDAKEVAGEIVQNELDKRVKALIDDEIQALTRSMRPERVVSRTIVSYYLPNGKQKPREFFLIEHRGFHQVLFCNRLEDVRRSDADVIVLDVQNWEISPDKPVVQLNKGWLVPDSEKQVQEEIDALRARLPKHIVLVIYIRGNVSYLNHPNLESLYVLPANNQVTLLGHIVNGAHVAYGDRNFENYNVSDRNP